jgi:hypothetical protein
MIVASLLSAVAVGCQKGASSRTPELAHQQFRSALARNQIDEAYAMLAPEVQATVSHDRFAEIWHESAEIRAKWLGQPPGKTSVDVVGTSILAGKATTWTLQGDTFVAEAPSPPRAPQYTSPQALLRGLAAQLRKTAQAIENGHCHARPDACREFTDDLHVDARSLEAALSDAARLEIDHAAGRATVFRENGEIWFLLENSGQDGWLVVDSGFK